MTFISASIFKAYDIRGIVGYNLNCSIAQKIGEVFGSIVISQQQKSVIIGRDGRLSGAKLSMAFSAGLQLVGIQVIDLGIVITPMVYFSTYFLGVQSAVMVTGSHNPPNYNGFKMILNGKAIYGNAIQSLYKKVLRKNTACVLGVGSYCTYNIRNAYIARIKNNVQLIRPIKIAIDCGNGAAGAYAGELFRSIGCIVTELFCKIDGTFPNHHPDPASPINLQNLIQCVNQTDNELGLAFDGDGDRLGVVIKNSQIIFPDRQLMLFAADVLTRYPGEKILYDVKCTRHLVSWIHAYGGIPLMCKTGHSLMKAKMRETAAPLAGEMSGHIFFKDRWYGFDDGLYAGARLLELLSSEVDVSAKLQALPKSINTPEFQFSLNNHDENRALIARLKAEVQFPGAKQIIKIDGLRVEYSDGFGLMRVSNTIPVIGFRFEADTQQALLNIQKEFSRVILFIRPDLMLPF